MAGRFRMGVAREVGYKGNEETISMECHLV